MRRAEQIPTQYQHTGIFLRRLSVSKLAHGYLMLLNSKPIAFLSTACPAESQTFYVETLGLSLIEQTPYALVLDAKGITVRVQIVDSVTVAPYTAFGWEVANIDAVCQEMSAACVYMERYQELSQSDLGVWTSPGGAKIAWFKDPDGHLLSITQV